MVSVAQAPVEAVPLCRLQTPLHICDFAVALAQSTFAHTVKDWLSTQLHVRLWCPRTQGGVLS